MDKIIRTIPITFSKIDSYNVGDTRFTKCHIRLMHLGLNLNNSIFNKEVVEEALPSLFNTPILGYVKIDEDGDKDFKGHEQSLIIDGNEIKVVYKGHAYGVIPESCNPVFNTVKCEDGIERECLEVDGLIWNKIENSDIFIRDGIKKESMELEEDSIEGYFDEEGHFVFTKFRFYGACALGEDVSPAMVNASIATNFTTVDFDEIKSKLDQFNKYFENNKEKEKGENKLNKKLIDSILAEFSVEKDKLNFEITDTMTEEELRSKLQDFSTNEAVQEPKENTLSEDFINNVLKEFSVKREDLGEFSLEQTEDEFKKFVSDYATSIVHTVFSTYNEKRRMLQNALKNDSVRDEEDRLISATEYYIDDFDDVYAYLSKETYTKQDGWEYKKCRKKYTVSDDVVTFDDEEEEMISKWVTIEESEAINNARSAFEAQAAELERLKQFEADTLKDKRDAEIKVVFDKFDSKLSGVAEYTALKVNCDDMEVSEIEDKCYALVGRQNINFSVNNGTVPVIKTCVDEKDQHDDIDDGYGGILSRAYEK